MPQLPFDCLNEIFEYLDDLEDDKVTLRSCLLVNRLWCEVSVRILWRIIRNYHTLIACLPNDSKEILSRNGIVTLMSASRPPMFNYTSFCKVLSIYKVNNKIKELLNNQYPQNSNDNLSIITREIFKFLMNQISSLRVLYFCYLPNILKFTSFPGTKDCLKGLTELCCDSNIHPEFFHHLSQICRNIQSLTIYFEEVTSDGLADLISAQQNLKYLNVRSDEYGDLIADIIILLTNLPDSLIKLDLYGGEFYIPLSFIAKLTNLQEMILSFNNQIYLEDFKELQYATFSHLQVLKFQFECPRDELLIKFLENNGKNLKEIYVDDSDNSINLAIAKFCPNLRKLFTGFKNNEAETLKMIFNSCQYLESIKVWCCNDYLNEKELFEIFVKYSPKNFYELKLCYYSFGDALFGVVSELFPEELESFFISWSDRVPQESLSLIIIRNDSNRTLDEIDCNMEIIEEYTELGIIGEFRTIKHCLDDFEYDLYNINNKIILFS